MSYQIMNKELTACGLEGQGCIQWYEDNKELHLNPNYYTYGDVLVQTKRTVSGFEFKIKLFFRNHWYWKPSFHWRYGTYYFHWLFFMMWFDKCYVDRIDKVVKDHLSESSSKVK